MICVCMCVCVSVYCDNVLCPVSIYFDRIGCHVLYMCTGIP